MNAWTRQWLPAMLALTIVSGEAIAANSDHVPLVCGISFRGPDRQIELQGSGDLPANLRGVVERQIVDRLGSRYAADITFDRGQLMNLDQSSQAKDRTARPLYNLIYQFRLSPTETISACILLEPNGDVVQELSLPAWASGAAPPRLVTLADAKDVASQHGMSGSFKSVELRYFPDTDTLEWLFSKKTRERGPSLWGETLHIPVQDPGRVHWSKWEAIR
jgi:hypothetical protein